MPNGTDGSITIDTELDNSGFEKGSDKLLGAVKDLTNAVDNLGDNMMRSFSQVIPLLSSISGAVSSVNDRMAETATQAATANERVVSSEQEVSQAAAAAAQAVNQQGQSMGVLTSGAAAAQTTMSSLEREVNSLAAGMQNISRSADAGFSSGNAVLSFDAKLSAMEAKLTAAKAKLEQFAATKIPTDDYTWLTAAIQKAETEYDKLLDRQAKMKGAGVASKSKSWKTLAYDISLVQEKLATYKSDLASLEQAGQAFTLGENTDEYARMKASVDQTAASLERNRGLIDSEAIAQARLNVAAAQEQMIRAKTDSARAAAQENLKAAQQSLSGLAASMSNKGGAAPDESAISGWARFGQILKSAGSAAVKVVGTLAKASFAAIGKGISTAVGQLKKFVSQSSKATLTSNGLVRALTSIKTLLKTRIKRMFISAIVSGVQESIRALAQFSSEFDGAMSSIKNSAKGMSGNLSVSLGGLIGAIAPVLTKIIDMISTAITYLNAFFALLSGKSTMVVAKKQTDSYAKSLGGAAGAAEDLKDQVYGFDQLNKKSSDNDGGGSGAGAGDLFETVDIASMLPETAQNFFDGIKAAFEAGDWYGIGMIIAGGMNTAMGVVDEWIVGTLRPLGVKWAGNIAELLNGLVDGFDWTLLGKTIADGINTVFDIANTFLTTFNFESLGAGIANGINGLFTDIEWDLIGQIFANKWNALIDFIYGIVTTLDWSNVGSSISEFVENFLTTLDLDKAAEGIGVTLNGIATAFQSFLTETDWFGMASDFGDSINTLFNTVDWEQQGEALTDGINTAMGMLGEFISTIDFGAIGSDIATYLNTAVANIDWTELGATLGELLNAGLDLLITLVGESDWGQLIQNIVGGIGDAIGGMDLFTLLAKLGGVIVELFAQIPGIILGLVGGLTDVLAGIFESLGMDGIAGFFRGISDALADAGTWLKENLVDPVVDAIKDLFGIHSPSTVFADIGDSLISGLLEGITEAWSGITEFFDGVVSNLKTTLSTAWGDIKSTASTTWTNIKTSLSGTWNSLKTTASSTWGNMKSAAGDTWASIKGTATQTWGSIKTSLSSTWSSLKTTANTTFTNIKTAASTAWSNIKTTASQKWSDIKTDITTKWNGLKSTMTSTDWKSVGSNICSGIKNGITSGWTTLTSLVSQKAKSLLSAAKRALGIKSPSTVFRDEVGKNIGLGLAEGITDTEGAVLKTVSNLATDTADAFDSNALSISVEGNSLVSGLDVVADKLAGIAATFRSITDMLTSLGGLNMPQIAAGTVVPAQTKIDTASISSVSLAGFDGFTSDLDEYMADQSGLLRQILEVLRSLNLNIDPDSLARAMRTAQRAAARGFGGA